MSVKGGGEKISFSDENIDPWAKGKVPVDMLPVIIKIGRAHV